MHQHYWVYRLKIISHYSKTRNKPAFLLTFRPISLICYTKNIHKGLFAFCKPQVARYERIGISYFQVDVNLIHPVKYISIINIFPEMHVIHFFFVH